MNAFIEGSFAYSLLLGMLAAVNPCGFVLLPTYLVAYLGVDDGADTASRLRRSFVVGTSVSAGFVAVFVVVGTISRVFGDFLTQNAQYAALVIGVALIAAGVRMLRGWRPRLWVPSLSGSFSGKGVAGMFAFGVVYAVASIGCTIGLLTTAILGSFSRHGFVSGVLSVVLYGVGMGLLVTALTTTLAFAKGALARGGRSVMKWIDRVSSVLVLLTGVYLSWYWYVAITKSDEPGPFVDTVTRWQTAVAERITEAGSLALLAIFVLVIVAAVVVVRRTRTPSPQ